MAGSIQVHQYKRIIRYLESGGMASCLRIVKNSEFALFREQISLCIQEIIAFSNKKKKAISYLFEAIDVLASLHRARG